MLAGFCIQNTAAWTADLTLDKYVFFVLYINAVV